MPDVPDYADWTFKHGLLEQPPTSLALEHGLLVFGNVTWDGTETRIKYKGPPPSYYDVRQVEVPSFPWWDIVPP
jgi:hypothetical protein